MEIFDIIVCLAMIGLIVVSIIKKINIRVSFLMISLLGAVYYTLTRGVSIMGDAGTGSAALDIFDYVRSIFVKQGQDQLIMLMCVIGYVTYMNHIKATDLLCLILGKRLKNIKQPYLVLAATVIFTALLKWAIMSNIGQSALILATLYPVLLSLGITRATAASALVFATCVIWGPGNGLTVMLWGFGDTSMPIADYFARYELVNTFASLVLALVAFFFTSRYFDKKEGAVPETQWAEVKDPKELGIPMWYAILPFLPVILILVFSSLVVKSVIIPIATAQILSWIFVFFCEFIRKENKSEALEDTEKFWKGCADIMLINGGLLVVSNLFSDVLTKIGGITKLFEKVMPSGDASNISWIIILGCVFAFIFSLVTGNVISTTTLFGPIFANMLSPLGLSMHLAVKTLLPAGMISVALTPVSAANLFVAESCNVDIMTIVKRNLIPVITYAVSSIIITQFILVG